MQKPNQSQAEAGEVRTDPGRSRCRPSSDLLDALSRVHCPFIVAHVTPDADAVGAMLGLAAAFREHGVAPVVGLPGASLPAKLQFMAGLVPETSIVPEWKADSKYDAAIVLDTASEKRVNIHPPIDFNGSLPVFNIDHHLTNTDFGRFNWVDPQAGSTCELIARLLEELGWRPTPAAASLLYAGIYGDTAGFSLPSTTAEAMEIAADLIRCGADVGYIGEQLCRSQDRGDFELLRRVYDNTRLVAEGRIAYSSLTHREITEAGCTADDIDDQVSIPRALKGIRLAFLFSEGEPGVIRVNLRGEGRVSVLEVARRFGGGGHAQSAGIRFHGKAMDDAIAEVLKAATEHLGTLDRS